MSKTGDPLVEEVAEARRTITSDGYPMSIGELTNLYKDGELVIRPEYQRFFRWSDKQKSRLIESVLLGIPIPSIFVAQQEGGTWELVDGLQRVSTMLECQGELLDRDGTRLPQLTLLGTKFLPSLDGRQWEHADPEKSLSAAHRLDIKRAKVDIKIIKRESSPETKYDLFQRLNSYGSSLTAQELRSALLAAISTDFLSWIEGLASYPAFVEATQLSDRLLEERYDLELVLRFLLLHKWPSNNLNTSTLRDLPQLLDDGAVQMATAHPKGESAAESTFKGVFDVVQGAGGDNVFRRWEAKKATFAGSFLNSAFEVIALGLGFHVAQGSRYRTDLLGVARELWTRPDMSSGFATGKSTEARLVVLIPLGRKLLQANETPRSRRGRMARGRRAK